MNEQIAIFVKGSYLLSQGPLSIKAKQKVDKNCLNVFGFKDTIQNHVKRLVPGARILRIYWYERELDEPESEFLRRRVLSKNGVKLVTFASTESDEESDRTLTDSLLDEATALVDNNAVTDLLFIDDDLEAYTSLDDLQSKGIHIHFLDLGEISDEDTLDVRGSVDTYSSWTAEELTRFFLEEVTKPDQERSLGFFEANEPDELEEPVALSAALTDSKDESEPVSLRDSIQDPLPPAAYSKGSFETADRGFDESTRASPADVGQLDELVSAYVAKMPTEQIAYCITRWEQGMRDVPVLHDRNVLATCRRQLDRNLTPDERVDMRALFHQAVTNRSSEVDHTIFNKAAKPPAAQSFQDETLGLRSMDSRFEQSSPARFSSRSQFEPGASYTLASNIEGAEEVQEEDITEYVEIYVGQLTDEELRSCVLFWESGQIGVPSEFDKGTMALCRQELNRTLGEQEKFYMRKEFKRIAQEVAQERAMF